MYWGNDSWGRENWALHLYQTCDKHSPLSREDGVLFSYMKSSAGWPGLRNHVYFNGYTATSRTVTWWKRVEVGEVRWWRERAPSTELSHALHTTGHMYRGGLIYWVVGNEVWRTGKHGFGVKAPVWGGVPVGERPSLTYMPGPSPSQIGPGITYNRLVGQ